MVPPSAITISANSHNEKCRFFFGPLGPCGFCGPFGDLGDVGCDRLRLDDVSRAFKRDIRVGCCCSGINYRTSFLASASLPYFTQLVVYS